MFNLGKLQMGIERLAAVRYIVISTVILFFFGSLTRGMAETLDMKFYYSPDMAYKIINNLGYQGTKSYIGFLISDFGVIIFLAVTQMLIIACLLKKLAKQEKRVPFYFPPIVRGIFDLFENTLIMIMLLNYPVTFPVAAGAAGVMTLLKWVSMAVTMAVIIILTVKLVYETVKSKRHRVESL